MEERGRSLKEEGNALFKSGNYLKAAAVYTQAIKADPDSAALYSNRSAAFLNLVKVTKALSDAEMTIKLNPTWEKGYFRKGCALEAMERYEESLAAYREALNQNPQSAEVGTKVKRLVQLVRDKKSGQDTQQAKVIGSKSGTEPQQLRLDVVLGALPQGTGDVQKFLEVVIESAMKEWNDSNGKLQARVHMCFAKDASSKEFSPLVTVDKGFESPDTLSSCVAFLRQYAVDSSATAAVLVVSKKSISFPQVWKGQGTRKWRAGNSNGFFVQLETSAMRRLWFVPSNVEHGCNLCQTLEQLDIDAHAVLPPLFR